jgi:hypothetical protein|tara:strand:- start:2085 stop:2516 length:432 start_codon:yes stop_codon:yes gene_type:complete
MPKTHPVHVPEEIAEATISQVPTAAARKTPAKVKATTDAVPQDIENAIDALSEDQLERLRKRMGLQHTHVRERKRPVTNAQVRNTVRAIGEVTHVEGFVPDPGGRISDRGPEAEAFWRQRWENHDGDNLSEYDLDEMAQGASL